MQWRVEIDEMYNGYRYVIIFHHLGHRCGYVGIPKGHFLYGKGYGEECHELLLEDFGRAPSWEDSASTSPDGYFNVHGGLTYAGGGNEYPVPSDLWWFGFDCAHAGDKSDIYQAYQYGLINEEMFRTRHMIESKFPIPGDEIRSADYCITECKDLIDQIIKVTDLRIQSYM